MSGDVKTRNEFNDSPEGDQTFWVKEIQSSFDELKEWHKTAENVLDVYLDKRKDDIYQDDKNFNLFAANTGILKASLYARIPKPTASRRFNDYEDDAVRVAAIILERALSYELEHDNIFDTNAKSIIEDYLITGLGTAWVRYDADIQSQELQITDVEESDESETEDVQTEESILDEQTPVDYVHWKDFYYSPARTWSEVYWVARRVYMNEDEIIERFGEEFKDLVTVEKESTKSNNVISQAEIFEIWDKERKEIIWTSLHSDKILDKKADTLNLPGFFPCPKPLITNTITKKFIPSPEYELVRHQYLELNELNRRISNIVSATRIVGVYDAECKELAAILDGDTDENQMIGVDKWATFAQAGGISGQIDFMPIEQFAKVLPVLNQARDLTKAQIYELTGISDILRGSSSPYETAGAQKIKAQYASLRLSAKQNEVAEFFSDLVQKKAHLMCRFYEPQRLIARAGQLNSADSALIPQAIQIIKNGVLNQLRINVSVDALQLPNFDTEKEQRAQALQSIGGFLAQAIPASKQTPELTPLMLGLLQWSVAGYQATKEIEGLFDKASSDLTEGAKQPPPPNPEMVAAQAKAQKDAAEAQYNMALLQLKQTEAQNNFILGQGKIQVEREANQIQAVRWQAENQLKQLETKIDTLLASRELDVKRETAALNSQIAADATISAAKNVEMETAAKIRGQDIQDAQHSTEVLIGGLKGNNE